MADTDIVTVISCDQVSSTIPLKQALLSETLRNLHEDINLGEAIPLPNVKSDILTHIIEFMQNQDKIHTDEQKDLTPWELEYCSKMDQDTVFQLILGANYMDIRPLLEMMCSYVANQIKGKTPAEIRAHFNIPTDFTPEEEEQIRKENEWCQEK